MRTGSSSLQLIVTLLKTFSGRASILSDWICYLASFLNRWQREYCLLVSIVTWKLGQSHFYK